MAHRRCVLADRGQSAQGVAGAPKGTVPRPYAPRHGYLNSGNHTACCPFACHGQLRATEGRAERPDSLLVNPLYVVAGLICALTAASLVSGDRKLRRITALLCGGFGAFVALMGPIGVRRAVGVEMVNLLWRSFWITCAMFACLTALALVRREEK